MRWFWQKKDGVERVRIYDFDTKNVSMIPAPELAPGMVQVRVEGIEGPVWVDGARLKQNVYQHPPFPDDVRNLLREIKRHLDEVYPMSLEQWEDGFRRDRTPEREIAHWLHLGRIYSQFAERETGTDSNQRRKDIFRILVTCGISPREQVLTVGEQTSLSRLEAQQIIDTFFGGGDALDSLSVGSKVPPQ